MDQLEGKVAVVTGASSGIGRALSRRFADEGMKVVVADIDEAGLASAAAELAQRGADAVTVPTDVSNADDIEALATAALNRFGSVHLVCNNAGVGGGGAVADFDVDTWKRVIDIDLWGVLHGMRVFLPILVGQGEGHIVNTASVAGLFAGPFMGPYSVAKFGVVAISESAFLEQSLLGTGVGVSVLCPGWVSTAIADNMPLSASDETGVEAMIRDTVKGFVEGGMDPDDVAAEVVAAVRSHRFYILTHDDSRVPIRRRMQAILDGDDPPPIPMEAI
jgi:NAD(P)-dependent dehydrogenase (short-subunit alcohol dehydrogenase family)